MKQKKLGGTASSSDKCNGHVNNFHPANKNEYRTTNGNYFRNIQIKSNKPKNDAYIQYVLPQMSRFNNRSQQWLRFHESKTVQTSLRMRPIYFKFAFDEFIRSIVIVLLLFTAHCVVSGQQIDSQWNAKNTGE